MAWARIDSIILQGLQAEPLQVEAHLGPGLPSLAIVGQASAAVREARERVRAAISSAGLAMPSRRITVSLLPTELPKESTGLDLPIALAILAAAGQLAPAWLAQAIWVGELSLAGSLQPSRAPLALALAHGRWADPRPLVVPAADAPALQPFLNLSAGGQSLVFAQSLAHILKASRQLASPTAMNAPAVPAVALTMPSPGGAGLAPSALPSPPSLADRLAQGQHLSVFAALVALAGRHPMLLMGAPGVGKTLLARQLAALLPPISLQESLEQAAILSLESQAPPAPSRQAPVRMPHHTITVRALVGGGVPIRPGEASRAHAGLLFLDEISEMSSGVLEALREPLESGHVGLSRGERVLSLPARFQLLAALNPCACGHALSSQQACSCRPQQRVRPQARLSGPLLDRFPLVLALDPQRIEAPLASRHQNLLSSPEALHATIARAQACRAEAHESTPLPPPPPAALAVLHQESQRIGLSARAVWGVQQVAATCAQLVGAATITPDDIDLALRLREGVQRWQRSLLA